MIPRRDVTCKYYQLPKVSLTEIYKGIGYKTIIWAQLEINLAITCDLHQPSKLFLTYVLKDYFQESETKENGYPRGEGRGTSNFKAAVIYYKGWFYQLAL